MTLHVEVCHNPYFNRWFSAITLSSIAKMKHDVTILILIDGFLQLKVAYSYTHNKDVTILILIDGFLQ